MNLQPGNHLLHYTLVEKIGEGGMGVVWKATDGILGRTVAVKILPDLFAGDPERLARFEQEARLLASLNHPNIAAIHGLEKADSVRFLVLEMVPGQTLAERLERGRLPLHDSLAIGRQMAEALEAAHDKGIIHRDLKPANIKCPDDDVIKLLDFGLAKALAGETAGGSPDASPTYVAQSPTITTDRTKAGAILGTAAYMSPEQARGKPVDKRTDIWGFGCVLYECLAGAKPFPGETVTDILGAIIHVQPDWQALPPQTPPRVVRLLQHCLEKDSRKRLRDIGDARIELDEALAAGRAEGAARPATEASTSRDAVHRRTVIAAVAGVVLGAALGIGAWRMAGRNSDGSDVSRRIEGVRRLSLMMPEHVRPAQWALTPRGDRLILIGIEKGKVTEVAPLRMLYSRKLDSFSFEPVPGAEDIGGFFLSPDGRSVAFIKPVEKGASRFRLWKAAIDGGAPPLALAEWRPEWSNTTWLPGGDYLISFDDGRRFLRMPENMGGEGTSIEVKFHDAETEFSDPRALPDERAVLLNATTYSNDGWRVDVALMRLDSGEVRILFQRGGNARYVPTGHLLFSRGETLLAAPFDLERLEPTGEPVPLLNGLRAIASWEVGDFKIANDGTLVFPPGGLVAGRRKVAVAGPDGVVSSFIDAERLFEGDSGFDVTADGRKLAVVIGDPNGIYEIWSSDAERPGFRRLVAIPGADCAWPRWSPDGEEIAFVRNGRTEADGIYVRSADGGDEPIRVIANEPSAKTSYRIAAWTPDRSHLIASREREGKVDVLMAPVPRGGREAGEARPLLAGSHNKYGARISPDGRFIAFQSDESGRVELYAASFSVKGGVGRAVPLATLGGPRGPYQWSADGLSLFFASEGKVKSVPVQLEPSIRGGKVVEIADFEALKAVGPSGPYSVLADGRVVFLKRAEEEGDITRLNVVLDFFQELRRRVPAGASRSSSG